MGTLSKGTGAVAGISQRQGRYKRSAPAFLIILAALVLLLGYSMILSVCTGIAGGSFKQSQIPFHGAAMFANLLKAVHHQIGGNGKPNAGVIFLRIGTVSYTHLDVYKRQLPSRISTVREIY